MIKEVFGRHYEGKGNAVVIIAVVTEGTDWVAYISGVPEIPMNKVSNWVAKYGCVLPEEDARHIFQKEDFISLPYREAISLADCQFCDWLEGNTDYEK